MQYSETGPKILSHPSQKAVIIGYTWQTFEQPSFFESAPLNNPNL